MVHKIACPEPYRVKWNIHILKGPVLSSLSLLKGSSLLSPFCLQTGLLLLQRFSVQVGNTEPQEHTVLHDIEERCVLVGRYDLIPYTRTRSPDYGYSIRFCNGIRGGLLDFDPNVGRSLGVDD